MKHQKNLNPLYIRVFGLLFLTFFLFNCEDLGNGETPIPDDQNAIIDITYNENARVLSFESMDSFRNFISDASKKPITELKENPRLSNFYSLNDYNYDLGKKKLKQLRTGDKDDELIPDIDDEIVYDPYFASVLNENREILIEGFRVRIIREGVVITKADDVEFASDFVAKMKSNQDKFKKAEIIFTEKVTFLPELLLNPIEENTGNRKGRISVTSCPYGGSGAFGHDHECFQEYEGGVFRTKGQVWSQNFGIFASMGHSTKHQRKKFGIWWARDADYIETKMNVFEVEFEDAFGIEIIDLAPFTAYNFESDYNDNKANKVFDLQIGVFKTYSPYIKKLVKARKLKKYNTTHKTIKNGTVTELNLTFN